MLLAHIRDFRLNKGDLLQKTLKLCQLWHVKYRSIKPWTSLHEAHIPTGVLNRDLCPVLTGRRPAVRPGQRRVEPSQPASGWVRRPSALHQPPLQGWTAEGVERPRPSPSGHLVSAEGPTLINQVRFVHEDTTSQWKWTTPSFLPLFFSWQRFMSLRTSLKSGPTLHLHTRSQGNTVDVLVHRGKLTPSALYCLSTVRRSILHQH